MLHRHHLIIISLLLAVLPLDSTFGQFYKVYGYKTLDAGEIELVYWNSYVLSSDHQMNFFNNSVKQEGLMAHSFEAEYGLSHSWTVAAYFDFLDPVDEGMKYIRTKALMSHYSFFDKGSRPIDLALYVEYIVPKKGYKNSEELEIKLILEKDIDFWTIILNPTFEKKISGEDVAEGTEFNLSTGIYYRELRWFNFGVEYYGKYGELRDFKPKDEQQHYLFPVIDLFFKKQYHLHTGLGIGLTDAADKFVWKTIFGVEFK